MLLYHICRENSESLIFHGTSFKKSFSVNRRTASAKNGYSQFTSTDADLGRNNKNFSRRCSFAF